MITVAALDDGSVQIAHSDGAVDTQLTIDIDDARTLWADIGHALRAIDEGPDPNGEPPEEGAS